MIIITRRMTVVVMISLCVCVYVCVYVWCLFVFPLTDTQIQIKKLSGQECNVCGQVGRWVGMYTLVLDRMKV